jgi:alpha-tubulin suppressor-like RCC1 family protein
MLGACVGDEPAGPADGGVLPQTDASADGPPGACGDSAPDSCKGTCVNLQKDSKNCGACGVACEDAAECFEGVCNGRVVTDLATGFETSCIVQSSGSVSCWGRGQLAGLGRVFSGGVACNGTRRCQLEPLHVDLPPASQVSIGDAAACAVTRAGELYCWGRNQYGELGQPVGTAICEDQQSCVQTPTKVAGLPLVAEVSVSLSTTCARTRSNEVYCWGHAGSGLLSVEGGVATPVPQQVPGLTGATRLAVSGDSNHACVLKGTQVWCWGDSQHGAVGQPPVAGHLPPQQVAAASFPLGAAAVSIVTGAGHTCAVDSNGTIRCWGYSGYGVAQASTQADTNVARIVDAGGPALTVTGRMTTACALLRDGHVRCWGESSSARLGFVDTTTTPCVAGQKWRCNDGTPLPIEGTNVAALQMVRAGLYLTRDGRLRSWGDNRNGLLGSDPATGPATCPEAVDEPSVTSPCSNIPQVLQIP